MTAAIEPLRAADVEALCELAREIWRAHYPPIIGEAQTEYMLEQRYRPEIVRAELACDDLWWDTLRDESSLVAFAASFRDETLETLKLDKLYVHPQRQGRGYGRRLIDHACARGRRLGMRRVVLAVNKRNAGAIAAYRRIGFEVVAAVVKDIGGGFVMDDYVMEKEL